LRYSNTSQYATWIDLYVLYDIFTLKECSVILMTSCGSSFVCSRAIPICVSVRFPIKYYIMRGQELINLKQSKITNTRIFFIKFSSRLFNCAICINHMPWQLLTFAWFPKEIHKYGSWQNKHGLELLYGIWEVKCVINLYPKLIFRPSQFILKLTGQNYSILRHITWKKKSIYNWNYPRTIVQD
jgi:hypothetical protein